MGVIISYCCSYHGFDTYCCLVCHIPVFTFISYMCWPLCKYVLSHPVQNLLWIFDGTYWSLHLQITDSRSHFCAAVLVSFCGASYWGVVNSREDGLPLKADFLAALLPLLCIPAFFSLFTGLYKWYKMNHL